MLSAVAEVEPNDTFQTAQAVTIASGDVNLLTADDWLNITGAVSTPGDEDFFTFTIASASGVFFDIDARDVQAAGNLNSSLALFDAQGNAISGATNSQSYSFFNYHAPASSTNGGTTQDAALYEDLQPGTYAIRVSALGATSGDYRLLMLADSNYSTTVPVFNSLPGSADTFYLDFNGHSATNDGWTNGTYTAAPYNFDSNPSTFSPAERLAMQNVWRTVSEDYSPFNINVSTVVPPNFNNGAALRMVVTSSAGSIVGQSANTLGVSFENSYAGAGVNTAFVFQGSFSAYSAGGISGRIVASAIEQGNTAAHEFGHTVGLDHYSSYVSTTANAIMATPDLGLDRETWQNATNVNGVNQDDVAIIASPINTFGYRTDDHGDTLSAATPLSPDSQGFSASGVIERLTDADYFSFTLTAATAGDITVRADVNETFNDLNSKLRLFNASGVCWPATTPPGRSIPPSRNRCLREPTTSKSAATAPPAKKGNTASSSRRPPLRRRSPTTSATRPPPI